MLSNQRASNESKLNSKPSELCVKLINIFHSLDAKQDLTQKEKDHLRNEIKQEINKIKNTLPSWYRANIQYWLANRDAWFSR